MKMPFLSLILAVVFAGFGQAQDGTWWKAFTDAEKKLYIIAYTDGVIEGCYGPDLEKMLEGKGSKEEWNRKNSKCRVHSLPNMPLAEIISYLDKFYQDSNNVVIDLIEAVRSMSRRAQGIAQSEIDQELAETRRRASQKKSPQ